MYTAVSSYVSHLTVLEEYIAHLAAMNAMLNTHDALDVNKLTVILSTNSPGQTFALVLVTASTRIIFFFLKSFRCATAFSPQKRRSGNAAERLFLKSELTFLASASYPF
jgi:hypothetical protein